MQECFKKFNGISLSKKKAEKFTCISLGSHTLLQVYIKVPRGVQGIQTLRMAYLVLEPGCILTRMDLLDQDGLASLSKALHVILSKRHFPVLWLPLLTYATFGVWNHSADSQPGWSTGVWVGLSNRAKKTFSSLRPHPPQNAT